MTCRLVSASSTSPRATQALARRTRALAFAGSTPRAWSHCSRGCQRRGCGAWAGEIGDSGGRSAWADLVESLREAAELQEGGGAVVVQGEGEGRGVGRVLDALAVSAGIGGSLSCA